MVNRALAEALVEAYLETGFRHVPAAWLLETAERLAFLKDKFKDVPADVFYAIIHSDPTAVIKNDEVLKTGQYSEWLLRMYKSMPAGGEKNRFIEDLYKAKDDLTAFAKLKAKLPVEQRDINKIKSLRALSALIDPLRNVKTKGEEKREIKGEATKVLDSAEWSIIIPKTKEASCQYGSGTKWCTASEGYSYFEQYSRQGPLFIIISKTEKDSEGRQNKWQFHFPTDQYMDVQDQQINVDEFLAENVEVGKAIVAYYQKNLPEAKEMNRVIGMCDPEQLIPRLEEDPKAMRSISTLRLLDMLAQKKLSPQQVNRGLSINTQVMFADYGVYYVAGDWANVADFLANHAEFFKKVLDGEGGFHDNDYGSWRIRDLWDNLDEKTLAMVSEIAKSEGWDPEGEEEQDLEDWVEEQDGEIADALKYASSDAQASGVESEYYKTYTEAIEDILGKSEWKDIGTGGSKLVFLRGYQRFREDVKYISETRGATFDVGDDYTYIDYDRVLDQYAAALAEAGELANPNTDNIYGDFDASQFNEQAAERLHELMPEKPKPVQPAQPTAQPTES